MLSIGAEMNYKFLGKMNLDLPGNVYLINTDVFHAYMNIGTGWRFVIQNKFSKNPSIEQVYARIQEVGLNGLYTQ